MYSHARTGPWPAAQGAVRSTSKLARCKAVRHGEHCGLPRTQASQERGSPRGLRALAVLWECRPSVASTSGSVAPCSLGRKHKWLLTGMGPEKGQSQNSSLGSAATAPFHMKRSQIKRGQWSLAPCHLFTKKQQREVETEEERKELVQEEPRASCRDAVRQEGKLFQQRAGLRPAQCPHLSPQGLYQLLKVLAHRRCSRL